MKSIEIKVDLRTSTGKKPSAALHRQGLIPCVLYGGKQNVHFTGTLNDLRQIIYTPDIYVVKLQIEGDNKHLAILKDIQFHPVTDYPLHIDFIEVFEDKPATVALPITITGNSAGVRAGGKVYQKKRYLKVKGLIKNLPETLVVDISNLEIGQHIKIQDLKYDNIELLDPARAMVVGVATSRIAKGMEIEETTAVVSAEGAENAEAAGTAETPSKEK